MPVTMPTLAAFALASLILLIIPGPTIIMVIGQALAHGKRIALASVLGVGLGDLAAASLSLAGVGALLAASAAAFTVLKWLGAAYLVYLGIKLWRAPERSLSAAALEAPEGRPLTIFREAFVVTLLNPKGIVFFVAFVPQFIAPDRSYVAQAAVFVTLFVVLGMANAALYALSAAKLRSVFSAPKVLKRLERTGASCLVSAGLLSLAGRRPA